MINITPLSEKSKKFIEKAKLIHGDKFDYSLVNYNKAKININIICNIHGVFEQQPNSHLCGQGCPYCGLINRVVNKILSNDEFILRARKIHGELYDYSNIDYKKATIKIDITCKKHGIFQQTPNSHLRGKGCPRCKTSKGEVVVENYLKENNIIYETQKKFKDCINPKSGRKLPFDFYLPELNICVEFQGEQHYKPVDRFGGLIEFSNIKERDKIKKEFCIQNNISYIELNKDNVLCIKQYIKREENITPIEDIYT